MTEKERQILLLCLTSGQIDRKKRPLSLNGSARHWSTMAWRHCAVVSEPIAQHTLGYFATTLPEVFASMCSNREIERSQSRFRRLDSFS
jgi:hypothetical protein